MSEFFVLDEKNCGQEKMWDFDKKENFYKKLTD